MVKAFGVAKKTRIFLGIIITFCALLVIFSWHLQDVWLTQDRIDSLPMQYNVALGFFLAGLVVCFMGKYDKFVLIIVIFLLTLVGATFIEYLLKMNFGIDQIFIKDSMSTHYRSAYLGRMSLNTTLCFMLISILLALMQFWKNFKNIAIFIMAGLFVIFMMSGYSIFYYFFCHSSDSFYEWGNFSTMSIHATLGFLLLGAAVWCRLLEKMSGFQLKAFALTSLTGAAGLIFFWLVWKVLVMVQNNQIKTMTTLNLSIIEKALQVEMLHGILGREYIPIDDPTKHGEHNVSQSTFLARNEEAQIAPVSCQQFGNTTHQEDLCFEDFGSKKRFIYNPNSLVKALVNNQQMESYGMNLIYAGKSIFLSENNENLRYRSIWLQSKSFQFLGADWKIELWPVVEKLEILLIDLPLLFLILGWGIIFLLMGITQLWWISGEQNKKLIQETFERSQIQESLERMVHLDVLTELPNRRHFFVYLEEALQAVELEAKALAVVFLDVDNFKNINDEFGHEMGDAVLIALANKFRKNLRDTDFIARFGGDEFALLFQNFESKKNLEVMLSRYLNLVREPLVIGGQCIQISLSIGVAMYPAGGKTPRELVKSADKAMYQIKQAGKDGYGFYSAELKLRKPLNGPNGPNGPSIKDNEKG
jgi:diguanylate cyclase (GGDEF)-like protein